MSKSKLPEYYYLDTFRRFLCLLTATVLIFLSYQSGRENINFYSSSTVTDGIVEEYIYKPTRPVILFMSREGDQMRFISPTFGNSKKGDPITIKYRPDNPQDARINSFSDLWGRTALLCLFALTFVFGTISGIKPFPEKASKTLSPRRLLVGEIFRIVLLFSVFTLLTRVLPYPGSWKDSQAMAWLGAASRLGIRYPEDLVFFFCVVLNIMMAVLIFRETIKLWRHYRS